MLLNRKLFSIQLTTKAVSEADLIKAQKATAKAYGFTKEELRYFVLSGTVSNEAYINNKYKEINILTKNKKLVDLVSASDLPNIKALSKIVKKHYLCYPKILSL
jgi:hypothetical protein